ncbi:DUF7210 family protein [Brevibacillus sp. JB24b]|uniref:DUF7210 family protein n=1 Tax=Brevibacillus sp. JB24b TaxID=3422308 RepID=UPI003F6890C8
MSYTAKMRIRHNGEQYEIGDSIPDLKETEAKRLLDLQAIETDESTEKPQKTNKGSKPSTDKG